MKNKNRNDSINYFLNGKCWDFKSNWSKHILWEMMALQMQDSHPHGLFPSITPRWVIFKIRRVVAVLLLLLQVAISICGKRCSENALEKFSSQHLSTFNLKCLWSVLFLTEQQFLSWKRGICAWKSEEGKRIKELFL